MKLIAPHPDTRIALDHHYTFQPLLSPTEARLHHVLENLAGGRCRIVCKPRLADFIQHHDGLGAFNKISQKHVDFLVCRNEDWMPMLGVELDDHTHESKQVKARDMFVNDLFAYIGVPLVRVPVAELSMMDKLMEQLSRGWLRRSQTLALKTVSGMAATAA